MKNIQKGRKSLSEAEKEERQNFLVNETIEERTQRVLNPRIKRILKQIDSLINVVQSPRYKFSEEQKNKLVLSFSERLETLESSFKTNVKKEIEDVL